MRRSYSAFIITSLLILIVISSFITTHLPAKVAAKSLSLSSAPIPASGTIYTATGSTLIATNTSDGSNRWSDQNVSSCIDISGPVIDEKNSIVYLMDHDGSCTPGIYAVNASTGQDINGANGSPPLLPIPNISSYQPTIDNTGSLVKIVVYTTDNKMSSYKIDGTLLWSYHLSSTVTTTPVVANGNIYFGTADGHIEVLNDNTTSAQGALVGSYAISSGFTISTDLLIYTQALYFGTTQNGNTNTNVFALDISTSQPALKWNVQTPAPLTSFPNPIGTTVYIGTEADSTGHGHLMALDATTGKPIRPDFLTGKAVVGAIIGGNNIYVAADGLYSINMSTGQENWVINQSTTYYELGATSDTIIAVASIPGSTIDEAISAIDGSTLLSYTGIKIQGGYYYAAQRVIFNTTTPPVVRAKLFVLIQGFGTSLANNTPPKDSFGKNNGIASYLINTYKGSGILMYSYNGDDSKGYPNSYQCQDTFIHHANIYTLKLGKQLVDYLKGKSNIDVYLIAHSFGGVIAYGYLSYLEINNAFQGVIPGTVNDKLTGVVTMDSPLGGVANDYSQAKSLTLGIYKKQCLALKNQATTFALDDVFQLYNTGKKLPHGGFNSIPDELFGTKFTNEEIAVRAARQTINVLTIGNKLDFLYNPSVCKLVSGHRIPGTTDYLSAQWLEDKSTNIGVYGRVFSNGKQTCDNQQDLIVNHGLVFTEPSIQIALGQFIKGQPINALQVAPKGP